MAQKETNPQVLERRFRVARDIHGRPWGANISAKTQEPVELLKPQQWRAPYIPAPQYVRWVDDGETRRVDIDYAGDLRDRLAALEVWKSELWRKGRELHKDAFDPENPSPMLLATVGPKPASPEIPRAILKRVKGYEWLLGLTDVRPAWADKLYPPKVDPSLAFFADEGEEEDAGATDPVAPPTRRRKAVA